MATGRLELATQVNRKRESVDMQIVALVHRDNESYGISFPDLPGCISAASSLDELLLDGKEALDLHVEMMLQDGEALPDFRSLDALRADPESAEDFATAELVTLLPVDIPGRAVKVTITMEEHLLMRLNKAAERQGYTRSGFIAEAVRRKLAG
jgi:predicted RNase H-like HicB family nuclease